MVAEAISEIDAAPICRVYIFSRFVKSLTKIAFVNEYVVIEDAVRTNQEGYYL